VLLAATHRGSTAQIPIPPAPQLAGQASTASISGYITDTDGASIPAAQVTLAQEGRPPADTVTTTDGGFTFSSVPAGPFKLSITAAGFTPKQTSSELHSAETLQLPDIALSPASSTDIQVTASQAEIAEAQVHMEEKQRVLGVFPNFYVSYVSDPLPMSPKQKYQLALRTLIDPVSFVLIGITAATEQADNIYDWGQGAQGFGKRYAAAYGTFLTGDMLGNAVFPILFRQDPRYFYKGTGSKRSRVLYAIAMSVVCKGDNHHFQPDYSGILGGLAATGISNAYYPASDRTGVGVLFEGTAIAIGNSAIQNVIQEFVVRKLTPHVPPSNPVGELTTTPVAHNGSAAPPH
jgi:hypothetical protein